MIIGVGTDLVGVPRFERALHRTPGLLTRVFTVAERATAAGTPREQGVTRWPVSLTHDADLAAADGLS